MKYLTGVSNELTRNACRLDLGLLGTPAGATWRQKDHYGFWAADNGCFAETYRPGAFKADKWLAWLDCAGPEHCLWATLPDVVGDPIGTWERSSQYVEAVRSRGFRVSVVLQDGLENLPSILDEVFAASDDLFIGGSTEWKLGEAAAAITAQAVAAGKPVHMGRVNSLKRLRYAASIGCTSADGTYLNYGRKADREANTNRLLGWLDIVNEG